MPVTKGGLVHNHFMCMAHIDQVDNGRYLVVFREECGVSWSVREVWYPSESIKEIKGFMGRCYVREENRL